MKKILVCLLSALLLLSLAACGVPREEHEPFTAYEIGHLTLEQTAAQSFRFRVEAEGAEKLYISRSDAFDASVGEIAFTEQDGTFVFEQDLAAGDYFLYAVRGEERAVLPFTVPAMQPRAVRSGSLMQIRFEIDGGIGWSSFIDPNGKNVYKSDKTVYDDTAVAVGKNLSITTEFVTDRNYDAEKPYYFVVFEGKNGQMTYISYALTDTDTLFSSLSATFAGQGGAPVLSVSGTAAAAGYVAGVHSASGEEELGTQASAAGDFTVVCDLSAMTEAGIWYDARLYDAQTGQYFDLPYTAADGSTLTVGGRTYAFYDFEGQLKVAFAQQRGDLSDAFSSLSLTLAERDGKPVLTLTGNAAEQKTVSLAVRKDSVAYATAEGVWNGQTVTLSADLSRLSHTGNWYDIVVTVDGAEYDVFENSLPPLGGQINVNGHVYAFRSWEGVVKIAYDPTE